MSKFQKYFEFEVLKHGFFPVGGGSVKLTKKTITDYQGFNEDIDLEGTVYEYTDVGDITSLELFCFAHGKLRSAPDQITSLVQCKLKNAYAVNLAEKNIHTSSYNGKGGSLVCFFKITTS